MMEQSMKSLIAVLVVTSLVSLGALGHRDLWCDGDHDHDDDDHEEAHPEDFLVEVFHMYGDNDTCTIQYDEFERMLADLGIGEGGHTPHEHRHPTQKMVDHTCFESPELLEIFNVTGENGIRQAEFIAMSPAFIQQILQGCNNTSHDPHSARKDKPRDPLSAGKGAQQIKKSGIDGNKIHQ